MELRHLRYFVAVAEELSFTRAASRLHTAQPSLSQQIRQLETELGVTLLERSRHHVRLTPAGRQFLRDAQEILSRVDRAAARATRSAAGEIELAVGSFLAADVKILPRLRAALAAKLPHLQMVLHSKYAIDHIVGLHQAVLDVAFVRGPMVDTGLELYELLSEPLVIALPASHPAARLDVVTPEQVADLSCIPISRTTATGLHDTVTMFCREQRVSFHPVHQADNVMGHLNMIGAGLGYGLLPDYILGLTVPNVAVRPLGVSRVPTVTIELARRRETPSQGLEAFVRVVLECFRPQDVTHLKPAITKS